MTHDERRLNMGNEVEKAGSPNIYEAYGNSVARRTFPGDLLTFSKFGDYKAGQEKDDVPIGTRLVMHPPTTLIGWVRWEENHPIDFQVGLLSEGFVPPRRDTLGYLRQVSVGDVREWRREGSVAIVEPGRDDRGQR
jgi:hypothetical protein